jgi:hypothetical protein
MGAKADVPLGVAIERIKLAHRGVYSLVGPSETPVLQVNLRKLGGLEGRPETIYPPPINILLVLISSSPNLIEVPKGEPTYPLRRLMTNKLGEENVFPARRGWPIHSGDLEIPFMVRIEEMHMRRMAMVGESNVCDLNHRIAPKEENSTSRPNCRSLGKTLQPIPPNVHGISRRN